MKPPIKAIAGRRSGSIRYLPISQGVAAAGRADWPEAALPLALTKAAALLRDIGRSVRDVAMSWIGHNQLFRETLS
jgi:hypothetical protein